MKKLILLLIVSFSLSCVVEASPIPAIWYCMEMNKKNPGSCSSISEGEYPSGYILKQYVLKGDRVYEREYPSGYILKQYVLKGDRVYESEYPSGYILKQYSIH